jgi:acetyltransferase-like isoleucine patch superfamily enzyme
MTLMSAARLNLKIAIHHLWFNMLAGSALIPQPLRWLMWRAGGIDVASMRIFPGVTVTGEALSIGARSFLNHGVYLDAGSGRILIGHDTLIGPQVMILTATHQLDGGQVDHSRTSRNVIIGNNVWLGARSTILPGVTVGDGCVIAAGAVVTRDCESGGIYAGVPARRIRTLIPGARSSSGLA